jgi:hypothetical protein
MATVTLAGSRTEGRTAGRIGGVGGLVFVATVVVQNLLRATAPKNGAPADEIIRYFRSHRGADVVLTILFAIGAPGLFAFVGALHARLRSPQARPCATAGLLGVAGILAFFPMTLAIDQGLQAYVHRGSPSPEVVAALWTLHGAAFTVLFVPIGLALIGLTSASVAEGVLSPRWRAIGFVGGAALVVACAAMRAVLDDSPVAGLGLLGFLCWLAFVVAASIAMLREHAA